MIGFYLKTHRQSEECGSQEGLGQFLGDGGFVGEHQRRQHPGHQRDGLHLCIVAYLDDLQIE